MRNTARTLCRTSRRSGRGAGLSTAVIRALNAGRLGFTCGVTASASVCLARCVAAHFSLIPPPAALINTKNSLCDYCLSLKLILRQLLWPRQAELLYDGRFSRRPEVSVHADPPNLQQQTSGGGRPRPGPSAVPAAPTPTRPEQSQSVFC